MWKQFVKDYFVFTRKERKGIMAIILFILGITVLPFLFPLLVQEEPVDHSVFEREITRLKIDSAERKNNSYKRNGPALPYENVKTEMFYFDPNTAVVKDWIKLGLREKTAHTIQNYLSKGGRFYKPEDIRKIWGVSKQDADRLIPFIQIKNLKTNEGLYERQAYPERSPHEIKNRIAYVSVNTADTTAFKSLPGIGSKYAQRIINFRERLGGFYSVDQVGETFLLPDSTFQKIKPYLILEDFPVRKIKLNSATVEELKNHPYLRYYVANAIVQYRLQHGNFTSVSEVKKIMIITDSIFTRAAPYLSLD